MLLTFEFLESKLIIYNTMVFYCLSHPRDVSIPADESKNNYIFFVNLLRSRRVL